MTDKKRILAVDDESDILLIIKTALISEGFDVRTASSGAEGIQAANDFKPDLVILDLMMPEMSGFDTLKKMREIQDLKRTPVVMLTGISDKDKIREALDAGVEYYMIKPFEFHDLVSKVKLAISDSQKQAAL